MSHHIYHTQGIILGKAPFGESNYFFHIITKDFGVIGALGQGVRELKSKLRSNLQTFSYGDIDLVRGKDVWRVTNARTTRSFSRLMNESEKGAMYARVALFLRRLMPGEKAHAAVWNDLFAALCFLEEHALDSEMLKNIEAILVMRILNDLGYWGEQEAFKEFLKNGEWDDSLLSRFSPHRLKVQGTINLALRESHL